MKRLKSWLRRKWSVRAVDEFSALPFSQDEFARLIRSRSTADMKILANGLALHRSRFRRPTKVAS
jgi:hypothetical protein